MRKKITFYEFDGFDDGSGSTTDSIELSGLSAAELRYLDWFSEKNSRGAPVFQISNRSIRARQFVGTVCIGNKELQVLPKLLRSRANPERNKQILRNLFFMMEYVNQLSGIDSGVHKLAENNGSFVEAYIQIFANRLIHLLQRTPPKGYVKRKENLNCVRGKIQIKENLRYNSINQSCLFCEFDEFTLDNSFNQTFKFVASTLLRIASVIDTKKALLRAVSLLSDVETRAVSYDSVRNIVVPERSKELDAVFGMAKMFLRYLSVDIYSGRANAVAILIDMNGLFEDFIFHLLNRSRSALGIKEVHFQKGRRLVQGVREIGKPEFESRSLFDTFQDIVLDFESGSRLVIDTKYKHVSRSNSHYGILNADVYQLLAYRELNSCEKDAAVALIYPENEEKLRLEFRIDSENNICFSAATIDLGRDLRDGVGPLVEEFKQIFAGLGLQTIKHS